MHVQGPDPAATQFPPVVPNLVSQSPALVTEVPSVTTKFAAQPPSPQKSAPIGVVNPANLISNDVNNGQPECLQKSAPIVLAVYAITVVSWGQPFGEQKVAPNNAPAPIKVKVGNAEHPWAVAVTPAQKLAPVLPPNVPKVKEVNNGHPSWVPTPWQKKVSIPATTPLNYAVVKEGQPTLLTSALQNPDPNTLLGTPLNNAFYISGQVFMWQNVAPKDVIGIESIIVVANELP